MYCTHCTHRVVIIHGTMAQGELAEAALHTLFSQVLESQGGGGYGTGQGDQGDGDWEVRY